MRILLVEDDDRKAATVTRLLRGVAAGAQRAVSVHHARTAREAEVALAFERFDAIVTDWQMPLAAGLGISDAGAVVVAAAERRKIPCVVISGADRPAYPWLANGPLLRWAPVDGWTDSLRWLLARAGGVDAFGGKAGR